MKLITMYIVSEFGTSFEAHYMAFLYPTNIVNFNLIFIHELMAAII